MTVPEHQILELRGVSKVFRDFWMRPRVMAVRELTLSVARGEVLGLLGPNGSGKSTTIKMILNLLFPTRGQIAVFGRPPADIALKHRIGYLPEETHLYRYLNAEETLDFYGCLFRLPRAERRRRVGMLLDMVGLAGAQYRPIGEYSKGMQRRVGLAQALINDPDLLILDEPTTGMDPIATRQIKDLIGHLQSRGKTIILCTHLLGEVEDVCSRLAIMYGGRLRANGTVDELLSITGVQQIEVESLSPAAFAKIEAMLAEEPGTCLRGIHTPRRRLESLFLGVVQDAEREGLITSGATAGGPVAQFLAPADGKAIIKQLIAEDNEVVAMPPAGDKELPAAQPPDRSLLEAISANPSSSGDPPAVQPPMLARERPSAPTVSREPDRELLHHLTQGGDDR